MPRTEQNVSRKFSRHKASELPLDAAQKFAWVECQILQIMMGNLRFIDCPYCLSSVLLGGQALCCEPIGEATDTVLHRLENELLCETDGFANCAEPQSFAGAFENTLRLDASNTTQSIQ